MGLPVIIIGAGGHAKVLIDMLRLNSIKILGVTVSELEKSNTLSFNVDILGDDDHILMFPPDEVLLVNGLGSISVNEKRIQIFENFKKKGYSFASVIHPSAVISDAAKISEGTQIMAGVVIQPGTWIGKNAILNTSVSVDHDCHIGDNVHLAPGVTLSGGVTVGEGTHIGTGAVVIQGITIGRKATVAAGGVVVNDILDGVLVKGIPAKQVLQ